MVGLGKQGAGLLILSLSSVAVRAGPGGQPRKKVSDLASGIGSKCFFA